MEQRIHDNVYSKTAKADITSNRRFEEKFRDLLGDKDYEELANTLHDSIPKAIRVNTLKISKKELKQRLSYSDEGQGQGWSLGDIPWFDSGLIVEEEPTGTGIAKTIEYYLGYYYIQDAASMIPPLFLEPSSEDFILDLAAAPGSKTTQMAQMMQNNGFIIANDFRKERTAAMCSNLERMGVSNTLVTYIDILRYPKLGLGGFDKILLDVPCSDSGTVINNSKIAYTWSQGSIRKLGELQKNMLNRANKCLNEEGILVYSTCSMEPEENEEVIDYAVTKLGFEVEEFRPKGLVSRKGITNYAAKQFDPSVKKCTRIYPHDNYTEGFFVCRLKK